MDAVWDVLRWGGLVVGIVLCIVHVLFSVLFLWLIFSERPNYGNEVCVYLCHLGSYICRFME